MSFSRRAFPPIPLDTAHAAQDLGDENAPYVRLGNGMERLFDSSAPDLQGELWGEGPALTLQRSVATLLQGVERLTDQQASDATRKRVAWKYALHLSLTHPGFQAPSFCIFRHHLLANAPALHAFQSILTQVANLYLWPQEEGLLFTAEPLLASLCALTQSDSLESAFERALQSLAVAYPVWLRQIALPHWYVRYMGFSSTASRRPLPAEAMQADINYLFKVLAQPEASEVAQLVEIRRLRWSWEHNCDLCANSDRRCAICTQCIVGASIANGLAQP